jgi:hypothetical protein
LINLNFYLNSYLKSKIITNFFFKKGQVFGEESKDKKVLVLVHGYLDNSNSFKPIAPLLTTNQYYLIAIDLPGKYKIEIPGYKQIESSSVSSFSDTVLKLYCLIPI